MLIHAQNHAEHLHVRQYSNTRKHTPEHLLVACVFIHAQTHANTQQSICMYAEGAWCLGNSAALHWRTSFAHQHQPANDARAVYANAGKKLSEFVMGCVKTAWGRMRMFQLYHCQADIGWGQGTMDRQYGTCLWWECVWERIKEPSCNCPLLIYFCSMIKHTFIHALFPTIPSWKTLCVVSRHQLRAITFSRQNSNRPRWSVSVAKMAHGPPL